MQNQRKDVTIESIMQAYIDTGAYVKSTPLIRSEKLEELFGGAEIYLKLENLQYTGSFKVRGAANKMLSLSKEELSRGVTAASSGNHAQAVAYIAAKLGTKATIVMPENAPEAKVRGAKRYGAEIVLHGFTGGDRDEKCDELIKKHGYCLVHSHTDPFVISGHATVLVEAIMQMKDMTGSSFCEMVMPCGAGSLASGGSLAIKKLSPETLATAIEPAAVPSFTESLRAKKPVTVEMGQTIADGLRVSKAEPITYELIRDYTDSIILATEPSITEGVRAAILNGKIAAEPSGCVGIAAALDKKIDTGKGRKICFIITGGNADAKLLAEMLTAVQN